MADLILEIEQKYETIIAAHQQEINRLRETKAAIISSLRKDIGGQEAGSLKAKARLNPATFTNNSTKQSRQKTTRERLLLALDLMPLSGFGTSDLLQSVNEDGMGGEVNKNRALKVFKGLINEKRVEVKHKRSGNIGGIYRKITKGQQSPTTLVKPVVNKLPSTMIVIKRIEKALEKMDGEFTSAELLNVASNDGNGPEIHKPTFTTLFSRMTKAGMIITVTKQHAGTPGTYKKAEKVLTMSTQPDEG